MKKGHDVSYILKMNKTEQLAASQTMKWDGSLSEIDKELKIELMEYEKKIC